MYSDVIKERKSMFLWQMNLAVAAVQFECRKLFEALNFAVCLIKPILLVPFDNLALC